MFILNNGLKVTPQRLAILKLLRENVIHPTVEKVHFELLKEYPAISLTTVYNTLSRFVEAGMVRELDVDPHKKRFDHILEPHGHFHCRICDNVYDVIGSQPVSKDDMLNKKNVEGHRIDSISVNLKGVCKYCEVASA